MLQSWKFYGSDGSISKFQFRSDVDVISLAEYCNIDQKKFVRHCFTTPKYFIESFLTEYNCQELIRTIDRKSYYRTVYRKHG